MTTLYLPNDWQPRKYQLPVLKYFDAGGTRAVSVWARRHGKDNTAVNHTARASAQRVGLYWHVFPTLRQGRKALWNGIDRSGRRIIDQAFPEEYRIGAPREDEMMIRLASGSIWQVVGADNHDALVGSNPIGVVFSEWPLMPEATWDFIRPILTENGGWAWFIYTPRGKNHGHKVYQTAKGLMTEDLAAGKLPRWFAEIVDIKSAGHLDADKVIAEERASGMPEELIRQEYFCDFDIGNVGAIFAKEIERAKADGRVTEIPYDPNFPVETAWDIGHRDSTAIWFVQRVGFQVRVIDYYENRGEGLPHYVGVINGKPYAYQRHIGPHDLDQHWFGTGTTVREIAEGLGVRFEVAPKLAIADGVNAGRALLHKTWFAKGRTDEGVKALENYHYGWDEDKNVFTKDPVHDWSSHAASAWRYYATVPELEFLMPDWLKQTNPVFAGRVPSTGAWKPAKQTPAWMVEPKKDPLGAWR